MKCLEKEIELQSKMVAYTLKVSDRARQMRLSIYPDGAFVVTMPRNVSEGRVEEFIFKKAEWITRKLEYFKKFTGGLFIKSSKKHYAEFRDAARELCERRVGELNEAYGFTYNSINIRNQKTRWGSCSRKGNLNFNYKIALLPPHLADYLIIHELCHLGAFNHSSKFWSLVAQTLPNYRELRRELKTNRLSLH